MQGSFVRVVVSLCASVVLLKTAAKGDPPPKSQTPTKIVASAVRNIVYRDAKPVIDALREDLLPQELRSMTPAAREAAWAGWVLGRDQAIRARVAQGDEDSIINFLLFGTTFTKVPRSTAMDVARLARGVGELPSATEPASTTSSRAS